MAFKMMGGKTLKEKTGAGIPLSMKSPMYQMKKQGYNDKEDESLGMRTGAEKGKSQSMSSRRDESYGDFGKRGMKQMDKKAPVKQTAKQSAKLPEALVKEIASKKGGPKQKKDLDPRVEKGLATLKKKKEAQASAKKAREEAKKKMAAKKASDGVDKKQREKRVAKRARVDLVVDSLKTAGKSERLAAKKYGNKKRGGGLPLDASEKVSKTRSVAAKGTVKKALSDSYKKRMEKYKN